MVTSKEIVLSVPTEDYSGLSFEILKIRDIVVYKIVEKVHTKHEQSYETVVLHLTKDELIKLKEVIGEEIK